MKILPLQLQLFLKNILIFSGIKPSYLIAAINGCFDFGQWIKKYPCDVVFLKREAMYQYLNEVILENAPIDYLEFGVFQGASLRHWSSINKNPSSRFFGFDSFKGFTEIWEGLWQVSSKDSFNTKSLIPQFDDSRVTLIQGYFQSTLQKFLESYTRQKTLVVHIDADIYSATLFVLASLARIFHVRTILIFDEFSLVCHEFRAFRDFTRSFCLNYKVLAFTKGYTQVTIEIL
jgi:hypothetical protein